ncbi:glycosyl hydrolase family 28-related protein [Paenibacillus hodogayensis]|uniref:Glycosyl hydrolase family 28-related protein n=1 Tax=Paenibacillus hodogayensis TaxID=279208 RepID=A0ABV5VS88_9BACL
MSDHTMSRRKLLGTLGAAGAALAAGNLLGVPYGSAAGSVTGSVYGSSLGDTCCDAWINAADYGVVGDNVTDDTAALQAAADAARTNGKPLFIPQTMLVKITSTVNMRYIPYIESLGTIVSYVDHTYAILAGNDSRNSKTYRLFFASVTKSGTLNADDIGIRLVGLKNGKVTVMNCYYLQLFADAADVTMSSIAYSEFYLGRMINTLELYGAAGLSWINENTFYEGAVKKLVIDGVTYAHNNNVFIKTCVESAGSIIQIKKGVRNKFYDLRTEGGTQIEFAAGTYYNVLIDNFISAPGNTAGGAVVTDNGQENFVLSSMEALYRIDDVMRIDRTSLIYDNTAEVNNVQKVTRSGFDKLVAQNFAVIYETGLIPVQDIRRFKFDSDAKLFRFRVYAYDENKVLLNDRLYISNIGGWTLTGDYASFGTNVSTAWVVFNDPAVKYANLAVYHNGPGSFEYVRLMAYLKPTASAQTVETIRRLQQRPLVQAAKPVRGLAYAGQAVAKSDGSGFWMCTARIDSALAAAATSGATLVGVSSAAGMTAGDVVAVLLDDRTTHWSTISAVAGSTITLTNALTGSASAGGAVAAIRWV